jgi:4-hydroxyphenylpyruvate dioxygenase-like putative hemolysin
LPSTKRSGAGFGKVFAALGFRKAAEHVSKDVELWQQGAINLVINSEREGFAHASYITMGQSVGLRRGQSSCANRHVVKECPSMTP